MQELVWKQRLQSIFPYGKYKKHLGIWAIWMIVCLMFALSFFALSSSSNDRKINAILEDLEILKSKLSARDLELPALKLNDRPSASSIRHRERRSVEKHEEPKSPVHGPGGAVYVRWGRTSCPDNNTEPVYSGIAGGSWHDHHGAATNLQCLPTKPDWGRFESGVGGAFMYGIEYEDSMSGIMDMTNVQNSLVNHNVPCVVCRSNIRTSPLMIPAKNACFKGWHLEYHGYLMAGHHSSKSGTKYICVDESPEADPAGFRDEGGALLFRVTAQCGSLPCPRYVQNREFTCVVCTK